jgi:signal transduction histidine kinase
VQVAVLVRAATSAAQARYASRGVALTTELAPDLVVDGDAERLGQVLGNLLDNALRHTPPGGRVEVRAHARGRLVVLEVVDTGEGISAEHLGHVFERFYRADLARDRAHGGSGIGLAISKALVEAHGGRIEAHSEGPGKGATFRVELPSHLASTGRDGEDLRH